MLAQNLTNDWTVLTASNVALGKPANQTNTADGADPSRAVDGDASTCWVTASTTGEWTLDLKNYFNIEEVSIHAGMTASPLCPNG
ncbi:hypothetical protein DPMN_074531 [Dreissena polymorpha]|uniref:F5/8 type C domain-containing protein n=1 Tax=Dreissena polymorpha TaxID=45954 RepID=A0A9D4BKR2_DREPO|nr:hypothetical protein DPMN_074531 [Dreissena polymorpha]